jgi:peptidoglycan/LPS O-acetylase OafA/YrhL
MKKIQYTSSSKPHYVVLDFLRGIAATVILVFHYLEMIYPTDYSENILGHGFLAVDFFFCLSGFVIGYAYDERMKKIGVKRFFRNRLIRLHPMVIFGTMIGIIGFVADPFVENPFAPGWSKILGAALLSLMLIPSPFLPHRGGGLFPYNTPSWSLFFEYVANIVYTLILCRLKRRLLFVLWVISTAFLLYFSKKAGWLIGGWDITSVPDGFARVAFSFITGLLIFRYNLIRKHNFGLLLPTLLLLGVFFYPHRENDWIIESIIVIFIFPLIISMGAGTTVSETVCKFCDFFGRLSYPLYMTHITTVWIFGNYYNIYKPAGIWLTLIVSGLIIFNLLTAYFVMRWIDEPVRKWLNKKK